MSEATRTGRLRAETKLGIQLLVAGLVLGAVYVVWRGGGPFRHASNAALMDLVGCGIIAAVVWILLAIRALADGASGAETLDDGLVATAAALWMVALAPPRLSSYLETGATNDFIYGYVPACMVAALAVKAAAALWRARARWATVLRLCASTAAALAVLAALLWTVGGGDDAGAAAVRVLGACAVTVAGAVVAGTVGRRSVGA